MELSHRGEKGEKFKKRHPKKHHPKKKNKTPKTTTRENEQKGKQNTHTAKEEYGKKRKAAEAAPRAPRPGEKLLSSQNQTSSDL